VAAADSFDAIMRAAQSSGRLHVDNSVEGISQFTLMQRRPFDYQPQRTRRQVAFNHGQCVDVNLGLLSSISCMEMRRK
jgi:hypothetical protein